MASVGNGGLIIIYEQQQQQGERKKRPQKSFFFSFLLKPTHLSRYGHFVPSSLPAGVRVQQPGCHGDGLSARAGFERGSRSPGGSASGYRPFGHMVPLSSKGAPPSWPPLQHPQQSGAPSGSWVLLIPGHGCSLHQRATTCCWQSPKASLASLAVLPSGAVRY